MRDESKEGRGRPDCSAIENRDREKDFIKVGSGTEKLLRGDDRLSASLDRTRADITLVQRIS
jgi:hypothetical protein